MIENFIETPFYFQPAEASETRIHLPGLVHDVSIFNKFSTNSHKIVFFYTFFVQN